MELWWVLTEEEFPELAPTTFQDLPDPPGCLQTCMVSPRMLVCSMELWWVLTEDEFPELAPTTFQDLPDPTGCLQPCMVSPLVPREEEEFLHLAPATFQDPPNPADWMQPCVVFNTLSFLTAWWYFMLSPEPGLSWADLDWLQPDGDMVSPLMPGDVVVPVAAKASSHGKPGALLGGAGGHGTHTQLTLRSGWKCRKSVALSQSQHWRR